jgi:hypothetical protein
LRTSAAKGARTTPFFCEKLIVWPVWYTRVVFAMVVSSSYLCLQQREQQY